MVGRGLGPPTPTPPWAAAAGAERGETERLAWPCRPGALIIDTLCVRHEEFMCWGPAARGPVAC